LYLSRIREGTEEEPNQDSIDMQLTAQYPTTTILVRSRVVFVSTIDMCEESQKKKKKKPKCFLVLAVPRGDGILDDLDRSISTINVKKL
jgi:hypothetical protein